jgi:hypothetical protein
MTALARAGRTAVSPSRLALSRHRVAACGLDRLSPARRRLAKRSRFKMSASAPFIMDLPEGGIALPDRDRPFVWEPSGAMLPGCPDRASVWAFCPMIFTSSLVRGRAPDGLSSMMSRLGLSPTIGPTLCGSQTPSSTYSTHGSATSLMNCSGRTDELRGQSR